MPLRSRAHEAPRNPVYGTAEQQIGDEREKQNDDDELERMDAAEDHDLVDEIDHRTKSDHARDCRPSLVQALPTMAAFCQQRPEVCRSARARVLHPVANGVQHGHRWLKEKTERERSTRAADQVRPEAIPPFGHQALRQQALCRSTDIAAPRTWLHSSSLHACSRKPTAPRGRGSLTEVHD